jgi:diacylglycerol kinase (ATP)
LRVLVILNGVSRKKKLFYRAILPHLKKHVDTEVWETQYAGHAEDLACQGVAMGFGVILSAGGDGTMHQVVNGVMEGSAHVPVLGLIPLGSGNDLARSLGVKADPQQIVELLKHKRTTEVDVGLITAHDKNGKRITRHFINECSMGMGPEVVRRVNEGARMLGPGLMYLRSIIATFLLLKAEHLWVQAGTLKWSGKSRVTAIANGRTFGHGIYIAPNSSMTDGLFNVFIAADPPLLRFLMLLQALRRPAESRDACLTYAPATRVEVGSNKPLPLEADGELVGFSPFVCEVAVRKISFLR